MQLPVSTFHTALKRLKPIITKSTIPILSHIYAEVSGNQMVLGATDMDRWLRMVVPLDGTPDGFQATLPIAPLMTAADIAKKAKAEFINLDVTADGRTVSYVLDWAGGTFNGVGLPPADWPNLDLKDDPDLEDAPTGFQSALAFCRPTVSTEETRYYLNGVCLDTEDETNQLAFVATDGHRLHFQSINDMAEAVAQTFGAMPRVIAATGAVDWLLKNPAQQIGWHDTLLVATGQDAAGKWRFTAKLIDGTFPGYQHVMPAEDKTADRLTIQTKDLLAAAQLVHSFKLNEDSGPLKMELAENSAELAVISKSPTETAETAIVINRTGDDALSIGANATYLIDTLNAFKGETILLLTGQTPATAPIRFEPVDDCDQGRVAVLMPMRV